MCRFVAEPVAVEAIQMRVIHLVAGMLGELDLDSVRVPPEHLLAGADELADQLGSRLSRSALAFPFLLMAVHGRRQ
jgi:hypothetical protein